MKKIAVIPARSGSKGLKDKNIIDICGKPMLVYSIEAALKAGCFDRVILSTDSARYGEIGAAAGAEVVYRGEGVSDDKATTYMVLEDLFFRIDRDFDYFMLLQPTSPLRDECNVLDAVKLFEEHADRFDFLASVKEADHPRVLVHPLDADGSMRFFDTDYSTYRRQTYRDVTPNGAIYIAKLDEYLKQKHFYGEKSLGYFMSDFDSVDVDNLLDYKLACFCMEEKQKGKTIE